MPWPDQFFFWCLLTRCHIGDYSSKVDKEIYLFEDFVINFDVDLSIIFADDLDLGFSDVDGQAKLVTPFLDFIDFLTGKLNQTSIQFYTIMTKDEARLTDNIACLICRVWVAGT